MKTSDAALYALVFLYVCAVPASAPAQPVFSGTIESNAAAADGTKNGFTWSAEQFANLRMNFDAGEKAKVYTAMNAIANSAKESELDTKAEVERLYFTVREEKFDISAGFMRLAFGYGQAFKPSDFINPPNPLYPEARQKGALAAALSFYPSDLTKLQIFGADRSQPYAQYPGHSRPLAGAAADYHSPELSVQILYALQRAEQRSSHLPCNYCGGSLKFDAIAGFALDALYCYDGKDAPSTAGLQLAFGADYSFADGKLYTLAQYFYNGDGELAHDQTLSDLYGGEDWVHTEPEERVPEGGYSDYYRRYYFFLSTLYSLSDYTRLGGSLLTALEDISFLPALTLEHEPFQGMTLSVTARMPLDRHLFGARERGELGPDHSGYHASVSGSAKLKF